MDVSEQLQRTGIAVHDDYLRPAQVQELLDCLGARRLRGEFAAARVGAAASLQHVPAVRGDATCWLSEPLLAAEAALLVEWEQLRQRLNRDLYLGLFELEAHYAWYAPGAGYLRHVDQPQGRSERRVSLILYLNENWHDGAGGELELFDAHAGCRLVQPIAGRLVCFLTAGREHAVRPAQRDRFSVTGWLRSRSAS